MAAVTGSDCSHLNKNIAALAFSHRSCEPCRAPQEPRVRFLPLLLPFSGLLPSLVSVSPSTKCRCQEYLLCDIFFFLSGKNKSDDSHTA